MKKLMFLLAIVSLVALPLGSALAKPNLNPGKWEITTQTEMAGMPGMIPPVTHTQCLKADVLVPQKTSKECKITDIKQDGDAISWKIVCSGKDGEMEGTGTVIYKGDTMSGTMDLVIKGEGMRIKNTITGKRIGNCD